MSGKKRHASLSTCFEAGCAGHTLFFLSSSKGADSDRPVAASRTAIRGSGQRARLLEQKGKQPSKGPPRRQGGADEHGQFCWSCLFSCHPGTQQKKTNFRLIDLIPHPLHTHTAHGCFQSDVCLRAFPAHAHHGTQTRAHSRTHGAFL